MTARGRGPHPLPVFLALVQAACGDDRARLAAVLAGVRRYQQAPVPDPRPERPVVARMGGVCLRDHGGGGSGPIVLVVPSLINPPTVLDLAPGNSLLAALAGQGLRPLLVDWGAAPEPLGLDALVAERLVPLVAGLGVPVALLGYCLGGTLALWAAARLGPQARRLALLAAPAHFGGYDAAARARLAGWWQQAAPMAEGLGLVPMDLLQPAFWTLDPEGLVAKYARYAALAEGAEARAFEMLEDWSNGGAPLSLAAGRDLAGLFAAAETVPAASLPTLDVVAMADRIVPAAASLSSGGGSATRLEIAAGHVGMVVGRQAPDRLWRPLGEWLASGGLSV